MNKKIKDISDYLDILKIGEHLEYEIDVAKKKNLHGSSDFFILLN